MSFVYVVRVFQDIAIVTVDNCPHLIMKGQKYTNHLNLMRGKPIRRKLSSHRVAKE